MKAAGQCDRRLRLQLARLIRVTLISLAGTVRTGLATRGDLIRCFQSVGKLSCPEASQPVDLQDMSW